MSFKCKECDKEFDTGAALHRHFKIHDMTLADYYTKHFPRKNLLTGELLPFKNKNDYSTNWNGIFIIINGNSYDK